MTTSGLPFDDFRRLLARLPALKGAAHGPVAPPGLGRLGALADWLALVGGRRPPRVTRPLVALYAGTHGVARHLDDAEGPEAARARVERIGTGQGPVGRLCREAGLGLRVYDLALDHPVGDITREPAMDERGCAATMAFGMEAIAGGVDLIVLGD
ncbi:nicotinate-nucleotide--dimethylbenzimidazole phosphoribosyltransferase, partial [Aquibium sp. A9E412]|uniref:nicotinate-nucleotide--dimethylbenzimidazole phosphoribosyltransferase n=1 Tax=Aquibium sp. A9E412 TaxID=2976767 RepID=UPI0025AEEE67